MTSLMQGKTVLVTGAGGFVGSHIVRRLLAEGCIVHVCIHGTKPSWRLHDLEGKITVHSINLTDKVATKKLIDSVGPAYLFHAATYGGFPTQQDIETTVATNIHGTLNLLEAVEGSTTLKKFVNIGSSSEYGTKEKPMREDDVLVPLTPYAITKVTQTFFVDLFARTRNVPALTLRLFSVYGPYEDSARLVPSIMQSLVRGTSPKLSSPDPRRDFVFIDDVAEAALVAAVSQISDGSVFNVGTGAEHTIKEVVDIACATSGHSVPIEWGSVSSRSFDTTHWVADISKTQSVLGWRARHDMQMGLAKTFEWFSANIAMYDR